LGGENLRTLLHICCGPCAIYPVNLLREQGHGLTGYFYNPNIHPYTEWSRRKEALAGYAGIIDLPVIIDESYDLDDFLRSVAHREARRCGFCYALRLRRAAAVAREGKYEFFTTTLLVSPYQKHDLIKETGLAAGEEYGTPFLYHDFRPGFQEATAKSRDLNMYRQKYCGCIYSERDRYHRQRKKEG
jgi:predicted adenine nucleotide alpha hydrolase (AANH) superfamily ATPase